MSFYKRALSVLCISLLLLGCNRTPTVTATSSETDTSGSESSMLSPLEAEALSELPLVETPTVERNTSSTARRYRVTLGAPAPTSGVLLNDEAISFVFAESEAFEERCRAAIAAQRDRDAARLGLETGELQLQINTDRERFRIILDGRDREISRLLHLNETIVNNSSSFPLESILIGVGSLAIGLVAGFVVGFFYNP